MDKPVWLPMYTVYFMNNVYSKCIHTVHNLYSNFHVLEEDLAYFRKVFNNSYNANEFYLKDIHGLYIAMMEDMSFM